MSCVRFAASLNPDFLATRIRRRIILRCLTRPLPVDGATDAECCEVATTAKLPSQADDSDCGEGPDDCSKNHPITRLGAAGATSATFELYRSGGWG